MALLTIRLDLFFQTIDLRVEGSDKLLDEVGLNEPPQVLIRTKSDEVGDPLLLTVLVDIWTGEGSVTTKPKELEPWTVTLHYGTDEFKNTIG